MIIMVKYVDNGELMMAFGNLVTGWWYTYPSEKYVPVTTNQWGILGISWSWGIPPSFKKEFVI